MEYANNGDADAGVDSPYGPAPAGRHLTVHIVRVFLLRFRPRIVFVCDRQPGM